MESIHGHDVIDMIINAGKPFTRPGLIAAIEEKFGPEARFHTCSAEGMDALQLVEFLERKGKFLVDDSGMTVDPGRVCQH